MVRATRIIDADLVKRMRFAKNIGMTYREIQELFRISHTTIYKYLGAEHD